MTDATEKTAGNQQVISIFASLFAFGLVYDQLVDFAEEQMLDDGKTADLVVFGTFVTVLGTLPLLGWRRWLLVLGAFASSGLPMWLGSHFRHRRRRQREKSLNA